MTLVIASNVAPNHGITRGFRSGEFGVYWSLVINNGHLVRSKFMLRNVLISCCHQCRICVIDYLRLILFLNVIAPRPVMCSFVLIYQCCFAIVKVLLKKYELRMDEQEPRHTPVASAT